jgi:hypothetical protein
MWFLPLSWPLWPFCTNVKMMLMSVRSCTWHHFCLACSLCKPGWSHATNQWIELYLVNMFFGSESYDSAEHASIWFSTSNISYLGLLDLVRNPFSTIHLSNHCIIQMHILLEELWHTNHRRGQSCSSWFIIEVKAYTNLITAPSSKHTTTWDTDISGKIWFDSRHFYPWFMDSIGESWSISNHCIQKPKCEFLERCHTNHFFVESLDGV